MNLLVLKKFNNYFNRKIIKYDSLDDYEDHSDSFTYLTDINFNPNDGVRTELVLGKGQLGAFFDFEKTDSPDYLVAYTTEVLHNPDEEDTYIHTIESRWFVLEAKRTRGGQFALQLKRDSISDNLNLLINCPAFIRKGSVRDDNPLVVNDEGITVNRIKESETLLKDGTNSAWIVGYLAKGEPNADINIQLPDERIPSVTIEELASEFGISSEDMSNVLTEDKDNISLFVNDNIEIIGWANYADSSWDEYRLKAGSTNGLDSFNYSNVAIAKHTNVSDCFSLQYPNPDYDYSGQEYKAESVLWSNAQVDKKGAKKLAELWQNACETYKAQIRANWKSYTTTPLLTRALFNKLSELSTSDNMLVYKNGFYYRVRVGDTQGTKNTGETYYAAATGGVMRTICDKVINDWNIWARANSPFSVNPRRIWELLQSLNRGKIFINYNENKTCFYLEKVTDIADVPGVSGHLSTTRNVIYDQPYDIFAIPASNTIIKNGVDEYEVIGDYAQKVAMEIVEKATTGKIYDVQLLPYCPVPEAVSNGKINITGLTSTEDYDWLDYTGAIGKRGTADVVPTVNEYAPQEYEATAAYQSTVNDADLLDWGWSAINQETESHAQQAFDDWIAGISTHKTVIGGKSKFEIYNQVQDPQSFEYADVVVTFWFTYTENGTVHKSIILYPKSNSFSVNLNYNLTLVDSMKIDSQCELYRIVAPNYQGSFDFKVANNGGFVSGFIADCTYKPYTPYIRVAPNFAWLYGTNFGDARGLICSGDFSIGLMENKWQEFLLQNKNYQNIFNREIQNLDVNQSIQRTQQYVAGGINIANAAGQGAVTGAIASGSPWGALAGGVIAGGASAGGYAADINLMEKGMIEQRQFALDKFHMQLGNIQALPNTLTKVGTFTINSKIWPFLEHYTCSDVEREAMRQKIKYEGMTIGIVDDLGQYMFDGYLQADLIRNDDIIDDPHQLEDIYIELTKGVYM